MPRILLEDVTATFLPDRAALTLALTEAQTNGRSPYPLKVPGKFSLCDTINGNNRRYPKRVWEKNLSAGSALMTSVAECSSLGLLEHPKDGKVDLLSPISHIVTKVMWAPQGGMVGESNNSEIDGEITIVGTAEGMKLRALIEAGYRPRVSSRGYGSVVKATDGVDDVQEDFVCEAWDAVASPSFKQAVLQPQRESLTEAPARPMTPEDRFAQINAAINAGLIKAESVRLENGVVILEGKANSAQLVGTTTGANIATVTATTITAGGVTAGQLGATTLTETLTPVVPASTQTTTTMDIKTLRESVNSLLSIDASKLDPRQISEGFNRMQELHREAAALTQDPKMSWDAQKIHADLDVTEKAWMESVKGPATTVTKLQEQQTRTLKMLRETASTGIKYRNQVAESLKAVEKKAALVTEVTRRGVGWRSRALKAESALQGSTGKLDLAMQSLDEFTVRYHQDTTKLARHALMVEHKGKIEADAALLKRVNEATRVEMLTAIREELTKPAAAPGTPAAPVVESKPATHAAPTAPAALTAAPVVATSAPANNVRVESNVRAFSISEAVAMTTRLSQASLAGLNG